jgi:peptide/nickel transport system substrate-binding protein
MIRSTRLLLAATAVAALMASPADAQTTVRLIPQADLKSFDPVWNTAAITQNHGFMIYDALYGMDPNLQPKPQMVESHAVSPDGLKYTFTLRPGLKFHDGTPVTAKDAVASLQRWGKKAVDGRALLERTASMTAVNDKTFEIVLKEPFGPILDALANPIGPPFVMREKEAQTDVGTQISEAVGSGPFIFVKEEWKPRTPTMSRAPSRPTASPAASRPRSTASSGPTSPTRTPPPRRC